MANTGKNPYGGQMSDANMEWMRRFDPEYWNQFQNLPGARGPGFGLPEGAQRRPTEAELARGPSTPRPVGVPPPQANPSGLTRLSPGVYRDERTGQVVRDADGQRPPQYRGSSPGFPPRVGPPLTQGPFPLSGGVRPGPIDPNTGTRGPIMPGSSARPGQIPADRGTFPAQDTIRDMGPEQGGMRGSQLAEYFLRRRGQRPNPTRYGS